MAPDKELVPASQLDEEEDLHPDLAPGPEEENDLRDPNVLSAIQNSQVPWQEGREESCPELCEA